jgi:hypothetical protein
MIINVFVQEFPEFLLAIAEENWIRGYHQALVDVAETQQAGQEEIDRVTEEYEKVTAQEETVDENTD